jgi:tRNA 2-thiouridine synthesizing protein E
VQLLAGGGGYVVEEEKEEDTMHTTGDINQYIRRPPTEAGFPDAPPGWTAEQARESADADGLYLSESHWEVVRALQSYFARHEGTAGINLRELHDALEERFHGAGGLRALYKLFPGGPVAQGCRIAGLKAPAHSQDSSFGSVA